MSRWHPSFCASTTRALTIHSRGTKIVPILLPLTQALGPRFLVLLKLAAPSSDSCFAGLPVSGFCRCQCTKMAKVLMLCGHLRRRGRKPTNESVVVRRVGTGSTAALRPRTSFGALAAALRPSASSQCRLGCIAPVLR
jgi:hypothetical protein